MKRRFPTPTRYKLVNPQKYAGDINEVWARSSWEKRFFIWADTNPSVIAWNSEETVVNYLCGTDNKMHRYFVDATLMIKDKNGKVGKFLVEIKPFVQTQKPKYPGRTTQRYLTEVETYIKNQSKWKAASQFAEKNGMQFIVLTERELGIGNGNKKHPVANTQ